MEGERHGVSTPVMPVFGGRRQKAQEFRTNLNYMRPLSPTPQINEGIHLLKNTLCRKQKQNKAIMWSIGGFLVALNILDIG